MTLITVESQQQIATLRLNNGVTNALSLDLIDELSQSIPKIKTECKGLVLAGGRSSSASGSIFPNY